MKPLLFAFLLFTVSIVQSQNVNIPDMVFKSVLVNNPAINTNGDGEIQITEAATVTGLHIMPRYSSSGDLTYIGPYDLSGIEAFSNLRTLMIDNYVQIAELDLSGLSSLVTINAMGAAHLGKIKLNGCTALDSLTLWGMGSTNDIYNYALDTIDLSDCSNLRFLSCTGYLGLDTIMLQNSVNMEDVALVYAGCRLTNIRMLTKLKRLVYQYAPAINLNCRNFNQLGEIDLFDVGNIDSLDLTDCSGLRKFRCYLYGQTSPITTVDLSNAPGLSELLLYGLPGIQYVNIKNGSSMPAGQPIIGTYPNNLIRICADDFEVTQVYNSIVNNGNTNVLVSSYCSFEPGGAYNTIKGNIRTDLNNNGCDNTDRAIFNVPLRLTGSQQSITASNTQGYYNFFTGGGNFSLVPYLPYPYFTVNPVSANISFDTANHLQQLQDFCLRPNGVHNDLAITFLPTFSAARPGFNAAYALVFKNRGNTTLSGAVTINFDNDRMNFISASENVTSQSTGQLAWNYNSLQPFESRTINVIFNLLPPPVNNIGDTIQYLAAISPAANDETPFDNSFILPQRITGSFDPNDKQCLEGSKLDISKIGDYLHYVIHFQNEGTDTAFNIVVADTLSDNLNWDSFEFIGSSHTTDVKLTNNKLEFFFPDINLPNKAIDEPGSNGWIAFKIKPKPSVIIGDSINNTAAIYFDFNLPVITNKATTIVSSASSPVPVRLEYFSVNQKNNTNIVNCKASCTYGNATFIIERSNDGIHFNSIGNINATSLRCQLPFNFTDNTPAAGKNYYRLKITDADGKSFYSKTVVIGNNKTGIEITAIANNTVYLSSNKQQIITMKVIAADGKEVWNQRQMIAAGNNNIQFSLPHAAKGFYTLIIYTGEGEMITKRFIQ